MTRWTTLISIAFATISLARADVRAEDSVPPLSNGNAPRTLDELWAGYDPRREPLDVEVAGQWEQDGIVLRVFRFRVGVFKGKKSMVAAIYGYPKGATKLPALVQLHGGGQHASIDPVIADARDGYACISVNWGGNPLYVGTRKYDGPNTDWGAVDATHPPRHNTVNHFISVAPDAFTVDSVSSPRNSDWFLVIMAARRAITFLERQPEVDPDRIGIYGHSMGGKLTTDTAGIDKRVKVAVPSCGGGGDMHRPGGEQTDWVKNTLFDQAYIPRVTCPTLYLGPTNDFNCWLDVMYENLGKLGTKDVRFSVTPHMNHRHRSDFAVTQRLFFDEHLKGTFSLPQTPRIQLNLKTPDGIPTVTVRPDVSRPIKGVEVYYSIDPDVLTRYWRDAGATPQGVGWTARCPLLSVDQPLFVLANVAYALPEVYRTTEKIDSFTITSVLASATPAALRDAGAKATDHPSPLIDDGARGWHDWYLLNWEHPPLWTAVTRKLKDPKYRGYDDARLLLEVKSTFDNTLVFSVFSNEWGVFPGNPIANYSAQIALKASNDWQTVEIQLSDLTPQTAKDQAVGFLKSWQYVTELSLSPSGTAFRDGVSIKLGGKAWQGAREIRNLRWEGRRQADTRPAETAKVNPGAFDEGFNEAIKKSVQQEKHP
jgi:hypothetical protein